MADLELTVTVPEHVADRVLAAICATHGYQANGLLGVQETREQFAAAVLAAVVKTTVADHEAAAAADAAASAARAKVEDEIELR